MSDYGFTPGPWKASYDDYNGEHVIRMGEAIETPWEHPSEQVIRYEHSLYPSDENEAAQWAIADANARLIAASPPIPPHECARCIAIVARAERQWSNARG